MRVCLVSRELAPFSGWGIGTYTAHMSVALQRAGDEAHILTKPAKDLYEGACRQLRGACIHTLDIKNALSHLPARAADRPIATLNRLRELHARHHFDYIEFPDLMGDAYHVIQAKRTLGEFDDAVIGVRLHSPVFLLREINRQRTLGANVAICEHMEMEAIRGADVVLAPSRAIIDRVTERLGKRIAAPWRDAPTPIHNLHNPFDPTLFAPDKVVRLEQPKRDTILAYGRLEYRKGFHVLIDAVTQLLEQGRDVRLSIIGADTDTWPGRRSVRAQLQQRVPDRWPDRFSFSRNCTRHALAAEIERAACCCFPSLWENFPYACLEAMAAGSLVIGSDAGGMAEIIEHDKSGFLFRAGDADRLARVLSTAVTSEGVRARIASNAPRRVAELADPTTVVKRLHDLVGAIKPPVIFAAEESPGTVSVIIPHKDMAESLPAAIRSARDQTHPPDAIIVVDDGSKDDDALALIDRLEDDDDLTIIRQPNKGLAGARNAAIDAATTDFIVPLDADDMLAPDFLERTLHAVAREPHLAMVTTLMSCFKAHPARPECGFAPIGLDPDTLPALNAASSCTALLRRSAVIAAGRYDQSLWAYEDWDLYCAMAERSMPSALVPDYLVHNRIRPGSMLRSVTGAGDHELRAAIIARHPNLARDPTRAARILLAHVTAARAAARRAKPTDRQVTTAARHIVESKPRYRLADRAARLARRTGLAPILKIFLKS